jgi:hypothetical protein
MQLQMKMILDALIPANYDAMELPPLNERAIRSADGGLIRSSGCVGMRVPMNWDSFIIEIMFSNMDAILIVVQIDIKILMRSCFA